MDKKDQGKVALADFFIAYSAMDEAVGDAIKAMLKVRGADEDLVVAALGDFARRASLVLAGLDSATTFGATQTAELPRLHENARDAGKKAIKKTYALNDMRVKLAHGHLAQNENGSFEVTHLKIASGTVKSTPDHLEMVELQTKTAQMLEIADSIRELARELSSVVIEIQAVDLTVAAPSIPSASGMFTGTRG